MICFVLKEIVEVLNTQMVNGKRGMEKVGCERDGLGKKTITIPIQQKKTNKS